VGSAEDYNVRQIEAGNITIEQVTEMVRYWQSGHELLVDGKCGPATQASISEILYREPLPGKWEPWPGPLWKLPSNDTEWYEVFGNPGAGSLDRQWFNENIVELHQIHGNALPFIPQHLYIKSHRYVEPYVREALRRTEVAVPSFVIERFGSYNYRHKGNNPRRDLSRHAFGAAFDINPTQNSARRFSNPDEKPVPWSDEWHQIWPDERSVSRGLVEAFESTGFTWGGRWSNPCDPMHFQLGSD